MKVFKYLISIVLVISCVMGIYCAGTNKTYDFKTHFESIAQITEELPPLDALGDIWDNEAFYPTEYGMKYSFPYTSWNEAEGVVHINAFVILQGEPEDWGVFAFVHEIVNGISLVTYKFLYTLQFLGDYLVSMLELVVKLSPTSGLVERGSI